MSEQEWIDIEDSLLVDSFDIPLDENIDNDYYYTLEEIKSLVNDRIKILQTLGYNFQSAQIVQYEIKDTTDIVAATKSVTNNKYLIVLSKYAMRRHNDHYLDSIIYHELSHILQLEHLFNIGMIAYRNNKLQADPDSIDFVMQMLYTNAGHTSLWRMFANRIDRLLPVNPPIADKLSTEDVSDILLESIYNYEYIDIDPWIVD